MSGELKHLVRISQPALIEMILSGVTAFEAGRRRGGEDVDSEVYVETGGHIWGYSNPVNGLNFHYIDSISTSTLATRHHDSITEHAEEVGVKRQIMALLRPELRLMGDFHTHPYGDLREVKDAKGWEASPQDRKFWLHHADHLWESSRGTPVNLVLAICADPKAPQSPLPITSNTYQFGLGEFRFWLTAIVGEEAEGRTLSRNRSAAVALWPLPLDSISRPGESIMAYDPVQSR